MLLRARSLPAPFLSRTPPVRLHSVSSGVPAPLFFALVAARATGPGSSSMPAGSAGPPLVQGALGAGSERARTRGPAKVAAKPWSTGRNFRQTLSSAGKSSSACPARKPASPPRIRSRCRCFVKATRICCRLRERAHPLQSAAASRGRPVRPYPASPGLASSTCAPVPSRREDRRRQPGTMTQRGFE